MLVKREQNEKAERVKVWGFFFGFFFFFGGLFVFYVQREQEIILSEI